MLPSRAPPTASPTSSTTTSPFLDEHRDLVHRQYGNPLEHQHGDLPRARARRRPRRVIVGRRHDDPEPDRHDHSDPVLQQLAIAGPARCPDRIGEGELIEQLDDAQSTTSGTPSPSATTPPPWRVLAHCRGDADPGVIELDIGDELDLQRHGHDRRPLRHRRRRPPPRRRPPTPTPPPRRRRPRPRPTPTPSPSSTSSTGTGNITPAAAGLRGDDRVPRAPASATSQAQVTTKAERRRRGEEAGQEEELLPHRVRWTTSGEASRNRSPEDASHDDRAKTSRPAPSHSRAGRFASCPERTPRPPGACTRGDPWHARRPCSYPWRRSATMTAGHLPSRRANRHGQETSP